MSSIHLIDTQADTEIIVDGDNEITFDHPGDDFRAAMDDPEVLKSWLQLKGQIKGFVEIVCGRRERLRPID